MRSGVDSHHTYAEGFATGQKTKEAEKHVSTAARQHALARGWVCCADEAAGARRGEPLTAAEEDVADARVRGANPPPRTLEHAGTTTCRRARIR